MQPSFQLQANSPNRHPLLNRYSLAKRSAYPKGQPGSPYDSFSAGTIMALALIGAFSKLTNFTLTATSPHGLPGQAGQ